MLQDIKEFILMKKPLTCQYCEKMFSNQKVKNPMQIQSAKKRYIHCLLYEAKSGYFEPRLQEPIGHYSTENCSSDRL